MAGPSTLQDTKVPAAMAARMPANTVRCVSSGWLLTTAPRYPGCAQGLLLPPATALAVLLRCLVPVLAMAVVGLLVPCLVDSNPVTPAALRPLLAAVTVCLLDDNILRWFVRSRSWALCRGAAAQQDRIEGWQSCANKSCRGCVDVKKVLDGFQGTSYFVA